MAQRISVMESPMQWRVQSWFWQQGDKQQKGQKWMLIHLEEKCGETSGLWLDGNTSVRGLNSGMRIQCKDSKQALAYQRHVLKYDKTLCELFIFWLFLEIHWKSNTNWSVFMCSLLASKSYLCIIDRPNNHVVLSLCGVGGVGGWVVFPAIT